jgi:hypothetical protein
MIILAVYFILALILMCLSLASYIDLMLKNPKNCIYRFSAPGAINGIAYYSNFLYVLGSQEIILYKTDGTKVKTVSTNRGYLQNIMIFNKEIYITSTPEDKNNIEVFDLNLNHNRTISVLVGGDLLWIINFEDRWYGLIAYYGKDQKQTRFVRFDKDWSIDQKWELPEDVLVSMYPGSCQCGRFIPNGDLYVTGDEKGKVYVLRFLFGTLKHINTIEIPITGNGIDILTEGGLTIYGINNIKGEIIAVKNCI